MEKEIEDLVRRIELSADQMERAIRRSLERTMRSFSFHLARETARDLQIPERLVKQRLYRRSGNLSERLSIIAYDLPTILLNPKQRASGVVAAGGRSIEGAFISKGRYGRLPRRVLRRVGSSRLPITEELVPVRSQILAVASRLELGIRYRFLTNLLHEIKFKGGLL